MAVFLFLPRGIPFVESRLASREIEYDWVLYHGICIYPWVGRNSTLMLDGWQFLGATEFGNVCESR